MRWGRCMYRVEDKYIMQNHKMFTLEQRIGNLLTPDSFCAEAGYKISSLYFDDMMDSMLTDTLDGNPFRVKYRIRIYNDSLSTIKLEVKKKKYNRVAKIASQITRDELHTLMSGGTISDQNNLDDAKTLFNLAVKQRGLKPKIIVAYDRNAYIYGAGNVRITFDRNIRACNQCDFFGKQDLNYDFLEDVGTVLEVKYDELIPRFIMQILETGNMLQSSNSKYGICRQIYQRRNWECLSKM